MASLVSRVHDPRLFVAHGTLDLIDLDTFEDVPLDYAANGLVSARENYAAVVCATEGGDVDVTAELWDGPPALHLDDWQDAAEISFTWTTTRVCVGPGEEDPEDAPQLVLPGPGATASGPTAATATTATYATRATRWRPTCSNSGRRPLPVPSRTRR